MVSSICHRDGSAIAEGGPEQTFLGEIHAYADRKCCLIRVSSICHHSGSAMAEGCPERTFLGEMHAYADRE